MSQYCFPVTKNNPLQTRSSGTRCWSKKVAQLFPKVAKNIHSSFYTNWSFSNETKSKQSFWATFVSKFVAKNFQKSPNLVTLKEWKSFMLIVIDGGGLNPFKAVTKRFFKRRTFLELLCSPKDMKRSDRLGANEPVFGSVCLFLCLPTYLPVSNCLAVFVWMRVVVVVAVCCYYCCNSLIDILWTL